jgi:hypothetical protein
MRIIMPKEMLTERVLKGFDEMGYRVLNQREGMVVVEGIFPLWITADLAGMKIREFTRICRRIAVEGGIKIRRGGTLFIKPKLTKRIAVRLSEDEYQALLRVAKERGYIRGERHIRQNLSSFFRDSLITSLLTRLEMTGKI